MMMHYLEDSFYNQIEALEKEAAVLCFEHDDRTIEKALRKAVLTLEDLPVLLSIKEDDHLAALLEHARSITLQRFGPKITLYAPLYVSSFCENNCLYCGFKGSNTRERSRLSLEEIKQEAKHLLGRGFHHLLLVSGEAEKKAGYAFFEEIVETLAPQFDYLAVEIQPLAQEEYRGLYERGLDGVTIYQETYLRDPYARFHPSGRKSDYRYRLETPERAALSGLPNVGVGALLGLAPLSQEVFLLARHLEFLIKRYWRTTFALSFPRIRTENLDFTVPSPVADFDFIKVIAALRVIFPDTPFYLSTREEARVRDSMIHYGITHMSAESKTEPGAYTQKGGTAEQFEVEDQRSLDEIIAVLKRERVHPVFKDWDAGHRRTAQKGA